MAKTKADTIRVDLEEPLEGHHILVSQQEWSVGFLEDIQEGMREFRIKLLLDALLDLVVGGDLPHGVERDGLRKLNRDELLAVVKAAMSASKTPKND